MSEVATIRSGLQARAQQTIEEAFPKVDHLMQALGNQVIVQMRRAKNMSSGGILLPDESKDFDVQFVRVAKVLELGPIAYKKREDMIPWPEGAWVKVGDYVRVPSYAGGDSWRVFINEKEFVTFSSFNDYDIKAKIKGNPLDVIDYV